MAWIIYDVNSLNIIKILYAKDTAKKVLAAIWRGPKGHKFNYRIDKVDPQKLDQWRIWKILSQKYDT